MVKSKNPLDRPNKWLTAVTVVFGAFMAVMDLSVVNVALPYMMGTFSEDMSVITWIATSYSIAELIMVTMAGWWSVYLGRKKFYLISFGIFTGGSILAGTARTFPEMLVYRAFQGMGGGALIPLSQAILRETFSSEEQGMAMGFFGMGVVLAPGIGPILGGWLTDHYGWPAIFYINVPVSIAGMFMVWLFVRDPPYLRRGIKKIDWQGMVLLGVTLTAMQVVLERGQQEDWFASRLIIIGAIISIIAAIGLILRELTTSEPVINFRLLRNIPLATGSAIGITFGLTLFGSVFILPQFTQNLLGYSAFQAGLVLSPRAIMLFIFMPVTGWIFRRVDPRLLVFSGILIIVKSYFDLSHLSLDAGFWNIVFDLLIMGVGLPLVFVTISTVSLGSVPNEDVTHASSIFTLARRVGGNVGYALVATLVERGIQIHRSHLVGHLNPFSRNFQTFRADAAATLQQTGISPTAIEKVFYALTDRLVERQATMMAYNHVFRFLGLLFLFTMPLLLLLPSHKRLDELNAEQAGEHR